MEGTDKAASPQGHQILSAVVMGKNLMLSLDCKNCHQVDKKSIGPSYVDVAKKYQKNPDAGSYLSDKIIKGGGGVWGEVAMAAHPNLKQEDARQIVAWIQSLGETGDKRSLPASGSLAPVMRMPEKDNGLLYVTATYTDKGGNNIKPMTGTSSIVLRNSKMQFSNTTNLKGYTSIEYNGMHIMIVPKEVASFSLENIDLAGVTAAVLSAGWQKAPDFGFSFELRLDSPDGKKLGEGSTTGGIPVKGPMGGIEIQIKLEPVTDGKLHNLYIVSKAINDKESSRIGLRSIRFIAK
jgi:cytochrome c551/c552